MVLQQKGMLFLLIGLVLAVVSGCSTYHPPVRHLAADAALVIPGQTTKKEILSYFGEPDERRQDGSGDEVWIYSQVNKSFWRKMPYVGKRLGTEEYDVMNVSFSGDTVSSCVYRMFGEEEYKRLGTREKSEPHGKEE